MKKSTILLVTAAAFLAGDTVGVVRSNRRARKIIAKKDAHIEGLALRLIAVTDLIQDITRGVPPQEATATFLETKAFIDVITEEI